MVGCGGRLTAPRTDLRSHLKHSESEMRAKSLLMLAATTSLVIAMAPCVLIAQAIPGVLVQGENDALDLWLPKIRRPDGEYSNGLRLSFSRSIAPLWGRLLASASPCTGHERGTQRCLTTEFAIAQQIYTPIDAVNGPRPIDRPFVGWLHADVTANLSTAKRITSFRLIAGVTGPPSFAEEVQNAFHWAVGGPHVSGWRNQLAFFPAGSLTYTDQLRVVLATSSQHAIIDVLPAWSMQAGNSRTDAYSELVARAGFHISHPWSLASRESEGAHVFGVWLYGGVREAFVAYDQTLDRSWATGGNTYSVQRSPWVSSYQFGVAIRCRSFSTSFGGVHVAREYTTQSAPHSYGSITVTVDQGNSR